MRLERNKQIFKPVLSPIFRCFADHQTRALLFDLSRDISTMLMSKCYIHVNIKDVNELIRLG